MVELFTQTESVGQILQLNLPPTLRLTVSREQFERLATVNRELRLERNAQGELIVNPPTGGGTGKRNLSLSRQLGNWQDAHPELGEAFDSSTGFILPNGAYRSPDASWVSRERWDALSKEQQEGFVPLCPDFAIELRSKSDNLKPLREKMQEYLENGTKLGWLIDRKNGNLEIYRLGQDVEILNRPPEVSGENVLPGFVLNLRSIWD
jgi:Uma2 family endonuclease